MTTRTTPLTYLLSHPAAPARHWALVIGQISNLVDETPTCCANRCTNTLARTRVTIYIAHFGYCTIKRKLSPPPAPASTAVHFFSCQVQALVSEVSALPTVLQCLALHTTSRGITDSAVAVAGALLAAAHEGGWASSRDSPAGRKVCTHITLRFGIFWGTDWPGVRMLACFVLVLETQHS